MPTRYFTGTDDVRCDENLDQASDISFSIISCFKRDANTGLARIANAWNPTEGERFDFYINVNDQISLWSGDGSHSDTVTVPVGVWVVCAFSKLTGSNIPRYHMKRLDTGAYSHVDGNNTVTLLSILRATTTAVWIHGNNNSGNSALSGKIAWSATIPTIMSDVQFEALTSAMDVRDFGADRMWIFDQLSVADAVLDITATNCDELTRTGTTVSTDIPPRPWGNIGQFAAPMVDSVDSNWIAVE